MHFNRHSKCLKGENSGDKMDYQSERDRCLQKSTVLTKNQNDNYREWLLCGAMWWWNDVFNHIDDEAIWLQGRNVIHLFHCAELTMSAVAGSWQNNSVKCKLVFEGEKKWNETEKLTKICVGFLFTQWTAWTLNITLLNTFIDYWIKEL